VYQTADLEVTQELICGGYTGDKGVKRILYDGTRGQKSGGRTRSFETYSRGAHDCTDAGEEDIKMFGQYGEQMIFTWQT
jgi:hypothetical protein